MITDRFSVARPVSSDITPEDWSTLATCWHPVAYLDEVADKPVAAKLLDVDLVIYRTGNEVVVARDICLHRGAKMSAGWMEGCNIVCPYHGFQYGAGGKCTKIPAHPGARIPDHIRLITVPSREAFGLLWVRLLDEEHPTATFADWSEYDDPAFLHMRLPVYSWETSAARQVENFHDQAHLSIVHRNSFGNDLSAEVNDYAVDKHPDRLFMRTFYDAKDFQYSGDGASVRLEYENTVQFPFTSKFKSTDPQGRIYMIFCATAPTSAKACTVFFQMTQNFELDGPLEEQIAKEMQVQGEDHATVITQKPEELPLDLGAELHIGADKFSVAYRRGLGDLGLGRTFSA